MKHCTMRYSVCFLLLAAVGPHIQCYCTYYHHRWDVVKGTRLQAECRSSFYVNDVRPSRHTARLGFSAATDL